MHALIPLIAHALQTFGWSHTPVANTVRIFARSMFVTAVSTACQDHLRCDECLGFASTDNDYNNPSTTVPCDCDCHTGKRMLIVHGQRYDYIPPADPEYADPNSPASRALEDMVRRVAEEQWADAHPTDGHEIPIVPVNTVQHIEDQDTEPLPSMLPIPTTVEEYERQALMTRGTFDGWRDTVSFSALGLAAEAGEAANVVCKIVYHGHPYTDDYREKVLEEVGDVLWFATSLLQITGFTLLDAMQANNKKLRARYNGKFSTAKSIARVDVPRSREETAV